MPAKPLQRVDHGFHATGKKRARPASGAICRVERCDRPVEIHVHSLCDAHYQRLRNGISLDEPLRHHQKGCNVEGCKRPHFGRGFCQTHRRRLITAPHLIGTPIRPIAKPGESEWKLSPYGYRTRSVGGKNVYEHREIMERCLGRALLSTETVHHKNGDRLDNRLRKGHELRCPRKCCNLELWSKSQPSGQRVIDKIKWATALLKLYAR